MHRPIGIDGLGAVSITGGRRSRDLSCQGLVSDCESSTVQSCVPSPPSPKHEFASVLDGGCRTGQSINQMAVVTQIRMDWAAYATGLGFTTWSSNLKMCLWRDATKNNCHDYPATARDCIWHRTSTADFVSTTGKCQQPRPKP